MMQHLVAPSTLIFALVLVGATVSSCLSKDIVEKYCQKELDFETIAEFNRFYDEFSKLSDAQLKAKTSLEGCFKDRHAIYGMKKILTTNDVCELHKVDEMIAYHKEHFVKGGGGGLFKKRKPMTRKFFTRYAIQVAYVCKQNLLRNLELARAELKDRSRVFDEAKERVYSDEPTIKSNIKLIEEQPDAPSSSNVKPQDEAELTLSEYREALTQLRLPEDILTFDRDECTKRRGRETLVTKDKVQTFFKPALMCHQLHRFYAGSLLSIAKLANIGYMALHEDLDSQIADDPMVRDWIVAVQVCEPMMYMKSNETRGELVVIDTCAEKVGAIEPMVYDDSFVELDNELIDGMLPKSEASRHRAQKIMKSTLKKMAKADLMKQLRSGANKRTIFRKSLSLAMSQQDSAATASSKLSGTMAAKSLSRFSIELTKGSYELLDMKEKTRPNLSEKEAYETLMQVVEGNEKDHAIASSGDNDIDKPVEFAIMSSIASSLMVIAIMLSFEWLFFIVMTLAGRICNRLYFNYENLLTFPPKVLSWSDADFARYTDTIEGMDEDDLFDYEDLNPDEQHQRELLSRVFGKPPPMLFRE